MSTFLLLIMGSVSAWAETATFEPSNFSGQGTSGTGSAISATVDGVTFACDKGYGTTEIRCYSGSKITISSSNTITAISFTFTGGRTGGMETSYTGLSTTSWEKSLSSQARLTKIEITYTSGGSQQLSVATPTFSPAGGTYSEAQAVTISCETDGATIYYTTDSSNPTTSSTQYTGAITVSESMTIKAIAVKSGFANSTVAEATYDMNFPKINAEDVNLSYDETLSGITYTITNDVNGTLEAAITGGNEGDWLEIYLYPEDFTVYLLCTANEGDAPRTATVTLTYTYDTDKTVTKEVTVTQGVEVHDYASLPFEWEGGASSALSALAGVTISGNGTDYSSDNHGAYIVKLDGTGDYIQVKTDSQPGKVTIGVKMIGGGNKSTITVQESSNGDTFTNVETLSVSGSQYDILTLETSNAFASASRYVRLYFTKGSNVGVGPITIAKASTDPVINAASSVELTAEETSGEIEYTISNPVEGTSLTAHEKTNVDWIYDVTIGAGKVIFTTTANTGGERTATITLVYGSVTKDVTVTQAEHVDINTYTLASSITSGKHYVIAATVSTTTKAMGGKNASKDYYEAIDVSLSGTTLSIASNSGVQEFVIYGPNADGYYSIYNPVAGGYLYASSSDSNDLSYQTTNDANGLWDIDIIDMEYGVTVEAQGTNSHNLLRYNNSAPRFSCYQSGQTAVQFYEKDGEATPTESITVTSAGYATYCSKNALDFSSLNVAYIAKANGTSVTLTPIDKVPAGVGIVLQGVGEYSVPSIMGSIDGYDATQNELVGITEETTVNAMDGYRTNYILSNEDDGVGFYKASGAKLSAHHAYLSTVVTTSNSGNGNVKEFLGFAETDGIETISVATENERTWYNLAGQRIASPSRGLYIVNSRKVVVK